jgi:hypothetical protein
LLDARIRISSLSGFPHMIDDPELKQRLERVFALLLRAGAKPDLVTKQSVPPHRFFADEPALTELLSLDPTREP